MYVAGTMMVLAAVVVAWQLPTQFSAAVGQRSMALIVLIVAICLHYAARIPASVARVI